MVEGVQSKNVGPGGGSDSSGAVNQEMLDAMIEEMPLRQMLMVPGMQVEMLEQLLAALNAPKKV